MKQGKGVGAAFTVRPEGRKKNIEHGLEGVDDWRLALARDKEDKSHKGKPRNGEDEKGKKQAKEFDWLA